MSGQKSERFELVPADSYDVGRRDEHAAAEPGEGVTGRGQLGQLAVDERDEQINPGSGSGSAPAAAQPSNAKDKKPVKGVFAVENNKTVFAAVETGITGENDIEIKSGLKEGQEIVTGPYRQLRTLKPDQTIKREDKNKKPAGSESK